MRELEDTGNGIYFTNCIFLFVRSTHCCLTKCIRKIVTDCGYVGFDQNGSLSRDVLPHVMHLSLVMNTYRFTVFFSFDNAPSGTYFES
jgi:hypothetical protein